MQLLIILSFILIAVLTLISYIIASFGLSVLFGAPYVGTPKDIARGMLQGAEVKPGETLLDLGSGSGTILIVAAKEFGVAQAIGYEINPILVWVTRYRAWKAGVGDRVVVKRTNFFKTPIPQVDVIALYLLGPTMDKMKEILRETQSPKTRIISRGFEFSNVLGKSQSAGRSTLRLYTVQDLE